MDTTKINQVITAIITSENLVNPKVTIQEAPVEIADELMSRMQRITITASNSEDLHLIIKIAPQPNDPMLSRIVSLLFRSETHFYNHIRCHFDRLQVKHTGSPVVFLPKTFPTEDDNIVVMDDVSVRGFKMLDFRKDIFTGQHIQLVLRELGKFHALSFALQAEDPVTWRQLSIDVDPCEMFTGEVADWFRDDLKVCCGLFETQPAIVCKLQRLRDEFGNVIADLLSNPAENTSVIVHLDTWCNNFLFRQSNDDVDDVVLIDFQQATKGSPALDVSCFLYKNSNPEVVNSWREHLKIYYDSLYAHAALLNCHLHFYTWENFLEDWKKFSKFGILKAILGIPSTSDETWQVRSVERIKCVVLHADRAGFLD